MPKAIFCFAVIFVQDGIVRYVAIVTVCIFPVRTVLPGCILGRHNVAVYAGSWIIAQIGRGTGNMHQKKEKTCQDGQKYNNRNFPLTGRFEDAQELWSRNHKGNVWNGNQI